MDTERVARRLAGILAIDMVGYSRQMEADAPKERRIQYRVGINLGDIVIDGDDIVGDGVNIAARLEGLAEPGGISVTASVFEQVVGKLDLVFDDLGELRPKNIRRPVRVYRVRLEIAANAGQRSSSGDAVVAARPSIAVLPLQDMSAGQDQEHFADGVAEDIITGLRATKPSSSSPATRRSPTRVGRWT